MNALSVGFRRLLLSVLVSGMYCPLHAQSTVGIWRYASYGFHNTHAAAYYRAMFQCVQLQEEVSLLKARVFDDDAHDDRTDNVRTVDIDLQLLVANRSRNDDQTDRSMNKNQAAASHGKITCIRVRNFLHVVFVLCRCTV